MWCPKCNKIKTCKAIPTTDARYGVSSGQRWYRTDHEDIRWFRRGRKCLTCHYTFLTAEADEELIDELIELREALQGIKADTEKYVKQSKLASKSLKQLNESLNKLRALDIYKQSPKTNSERKQR